LAGGWSCLYTCRLRAIMLIDNGLIFQSALRCGSGESVKKGGIFPIGKTYLD
jgi:hypothetical protein